MSALPGGCDSRRPPRNPHNANTNAIAWFVPDRREVIDGRSIYDPDIFSWQIPRLEYGSCSTGVSQWPRSTATGAAAPVYFANLTKESVRIRRINPDGTRTLLATLPTWTDLAHPVAGSGAIPYSSSTPAMVRLDSHVGAAYVVQTLGGTCVGTYLVGEPPVNAVPYQVAEIHSHGDGVGGILDH